MPSDQDVLFEASPSPAMRLSREGKVEAINRAARRVFGVEPERVIGRPVLGMIVPDDRARIRDLFLRVLQGRPCEWTTRFRRGDAATRVQRVRAVAHGGNGTGAPEGILMFTQDVDDGREPDPELRQLHSMLENLPGQFTAVVDRQGRIRASSGMARTHFRDDVDLVGEPYTTLLEVEEDDEDPSESMLQAVMDGEHWMGTLWHERVDGVCFPARTFASPWIHEQDGRVLGALVAGRDVSLEHTWRERAHRAERHAAIGQFAASIASEFDEGLNRVEMELGGTEGARAELARLRAFAGSVREISVEASSETSRVCLEEVAKEVVAEMGSRLKDGGITISVEGPAQAPRVVSDRNQISRLFEILLENAVESVEATGFGGGWVRVDIDVDADGLVTRVTDSGQGLPEDTLHRAFEPFFSTKSGRAGLGLTVARALVRAHEGRIWTDLDEDGHVVFAVLLPTEDQGATGRFRPVPLVLSSHRTILVVDDEEAIRLSMRRFLERIGYEVREAWSGRSALAQITGGSPPELVLTDLRMRDGSGFWFIGELERDFPDLLRKTVILTGDPDLEEVRRLATRTRCPVVGKPVELGELLELLDELQRRD